MKLSTAVCLGAGLIVWFLPGQAQAQRRHDPLNEQEIDQLRDSAQDPDTRLRLYIKFAQQRLEAAEAARSDPKVTDAGQQIHDRLQEFEDLYDELDDNVDTYADQRQDIRHVLKAVIEADAEFQKKLQALKDAKTTKQADQYQFVLSDAIDDLSDSAKDHTQLLAEQEEAAKQKKLIKPQPPSRANLKPQ